MAVSGKASKEGRSLKGLDATRSRIAVRKETRQAFFPRSLASRWGDGRAAAGRVKGALGVRVAVLLGGVEYVSVYWCMP